MNLNYFKTINFTPKNILDIGCNIGQFYNICKNTWYINFNITMIDGNENVISDIIKFNVPYHIVVLSDSIKNVEWYSTIENDKCTGDSYYKENTKHYSDDKLIIKNKQTNTLDNLFKTEIFDLIKIDTQGSEIDIIKGGLNVCKKSKFIILEVSLIEYNIQSPTENDVNLYMNDNKFKYITTIGYHYLDGKLIQKDNLYKNENSIS